MADEKLKHKPQKKRTLEEVLKSLQDLIRTDLMSAPAGNVSSRDSADVKSPPTPTGDEPETLRDALQRLDKIITEKIIEPVERAHDVPPEPLLPDEGIEIEWNDSGELDEGGDTDAKDESKLEPLEIAALDTIPQPLEEEIEIEPLASDAAPPSQPAIEVETQSSAAESTPEPLAETTVEGIELDSYPEPAKPAAEAIEIEAVQSVEPASEATVDLAETEASGETTDGQQTFDFKTPERLQDAETASDRSDERDIPATVELPEPAAPGGDDTTGDDTMSVDFAADVAETTEPTKVTQEQSDTGAVELSKTADEFIVEFTVEPKTPPADASPAPESGARVVALPGMGEPDLSTSAADHPPEESAVKKKSRPSDSPDASANGRPPANRPAAEDESTKKPSEHEPSAAEASPGEDEIPVLDDVADLQAPPSPPLPDASQARDIAIRVIAKLNIERRKVGEPSLDIKTIERLHQYLADALSKRALNKPKKK